MGQGQLKEKKVNQVVLNYKNIHQLASYPGIDKLATPPTNSNNQRLRYTSPDVKGRQTTRITKSRGKSVNRQRTHNYDSVNRSAGKGAQSGFL